MTFDSPAANKSPFDNIYRQRQVAFADNGTTGNDWLSAQRTATFGHGQNLGSYRSDAVGSSAREAMPLPTVVLTKDGTADDSTTRPAKLEVAAEQKKASEKPTRETLQPTIKSSLSFNDFAKNPAYDKFKLPDTRMDQSFNADGTTQVTYTAKDFSTCKMASKSDGTYGITVADRYGRPQQAEDIDGQGRSTLTAFAYNDVNGKPSPWAASKSFNYADGTNETHVYDKFGRMTSKTPITEVA
jgi:hypothetical protein